MERKISMTTERERILKCGPCGKETKHEEGFFAYEGMFFRGRTCLSCQNFRHSTQQILAN